LAFFVSESNKYRHLKVAVSP